MLQNQVTAPFNPKPSTVMHLDLNSCFATIEQQANPNFRGKPVVVAAYPTDNGCIIAPSTEAKRIGIKVGMRVREGKALYPKLIVLPPDPWKYRFVNRKLLHLLQEYSPKISVKSIDEMVLDFQNTPYLSKGVINLACKIKKRVKKEIGSFLTVSIGIAPNRFLAKTASLLHKPDGLDEINLQNFQEIYKKLRVEQLCGIKTGNGVRLNSAGIFTAFDMYQATVAKLKSAFCSILGYYWYLRLRGYEIDEIEFARKSYGQSYALYKPLTVETGITKILCKLVEKMGTRLRCAGYSAKGIHVACRYSDYSFWHHGQTLLQRIYASNDLYRAAVKVLFSSPIKKPVRLLAVSCFNLEKNRNYQLTLLPQEEKRRSLTLALDAITNKFGDFTVFPAIMMGTEDKVPDRVAFGGIKE